MARLFEIGDRVRARVSTLVPAGTLGRVYMEVLSVVDMYFVQFDGEQQPTLMRAVDLELITDAPADADAS